MAYFSVTSSLHSKKPDSLLFTYRVRKAVWVIRDEGYYDILDVVVRISGVLHRNLQEGVSGACLGG